MAAWRGGDDGTPGEVGEEDGCGGSREGGGVAAAPHRGTPPSDTHRTWLTGVAPNRKFMKREVTTGTYHGLPGSRRTNTVVIVPHVVVRLKQEQVKLAQSTPRRS